MVVIIADVRVRGQQILRLADEGLRDGSYKMGKRLQTSFKDPPLHFNEVSNINEV